MNKQELENLFTIDETSSSWLSRKNGKHLKAKESGYYTVTVNSKTYRIHRIIMILLGHDINGKLIDHIDRNKLNNNPNNLRVVSNTENARNCNMFKSNKTGVTGVSFNEQVKIIGVMWRRGKKVIN